MGAGTLVLGTGLAALVCFCDFPGRRWIEWALVLPLAMPGYVFTLFALGGADALGATWIPRALGGRRGGDLHAGALPLRLPARPHRVPGPGRRPGGGRPRAWASRAREAILRVAVPMARPAILGGVALALMESLADFGTVNLLGVQTFTNAIYKVWFGAFDRDAALQLGMMLVSVTLLLLAARARLARARPLRSEGGGARAPEPVRLRGACGRAGAAGPAALLAGRGGRRARGAARRLVGGVDLRRPAAHRLRPGRPQQPAAGRDVRAARGGRGAGARLRAPRRPARASGAGAVRVATIGYGLPGLGGGGGRDRAARLDRPPARRRRGRRPAAHRHRDRAVLRVRGALPRARVPVGRRRPRAGAALARRGRARPGLRSPRRARPRARRR